MRNTHDLGCPRDSNPITCSRAGVLAVERGAVYLEPNFTGHLILW